MIAAHKIGFRTSLATARMKLSLAGTLVLNDSNGLSGDPVLHGGSLRVVSGDGVMFDHVYSLPASNWSYVGPAGQNMGYRYRDSALALGPIRGIKVRDGRASTIMGRWPRNQIPLDSDPSPLGVTLALGGTRYCMSFGGTVSYVPDLRYGAVDAPAPTECAP
jgi:hypothetical protein